MKAASVLLLLLFLAVSPALSQVSDARLVAGGTHIGRWTLEMTVEDILRLNGPPRIGPSVFSDLVPGSAWYVWDSLGLGVATKDRKKIQYLAIVQPEYKTQSGIGHGSARKAVLSNYGEPAVETDIYSGRQRKIFTLLAYDKLGLAFFLSNDVVQMVLVFRTGTLETLIPDCG